MFVLVCAISVCSTFLLHNRFQMCWFVPLHTQVPQWRSGCLGADALIALYWARSQLCRGSPGMYLSLWSVWSERWLLAFWRLWRGCGALLCQMADIVATTTLAIILWCRCPNCGARQPLLPSSPHLLIITQLPQMTLSCPLHTFISFMICAIESVFDQMTLDFWRKVKIDDKKQPKNSCQEKQQCNDDNYKEEDNDDTDYNMKVTTTMRMVSPIKAGQVTAGKGWRAETHSGKAASTNSRNCVVLGRPCSILVLFPLLLVFICWCYF